MQFPASRILLFAKAPVPGAVKTRLIPVLGPDGAARLQAELLRDTVARLTSAGLAPVELWCAPTTGHPIFDELGAMTATTLHRQPEGDLGARLLHAAADALTRAEKVVLIGCDCPELGPAYLHQALQALAHAEVDAVLGPAADGGYVLLGIRRAEPRLFSEIAWGGKRVADTTRARIDALGWRRVELPVLRDLDRPDDLAWYRRRRMGRADARVDSGQTPRSRISSSTNLEPK
ncbi:MAG: TIGR04282 family arsenosugar biosynthesis glycosyltransferase [Thiohalocapsa sp.]